MTDQKQKYIVIKKHTLSYKVDDVIELTEEKAKALVGKVQLQSEAKTKTKAKVKFDVRKQSKKTEGAK